MTAGTPPHPRRDLAGELGRLGLRAGRSPIAGTGLFTTRARRAGDRIAVIAGELIDGAEAERRDAEGNVYIYELGDDAYVDAAAGLGRFVNHACVASCTVEDGSERSLVLVAARDLAPGEELTIDYDYEDILQACRLRNPLCLGAACPHAPGADAT